MKTNIIITLLALGFLSAYAQTYLSEGFEGGTKPTGWQNQFVVGGKLWEYQDGGHIPNPAFPEFRFPSGAHSGNYNAIFQIEVVGPKTKLVTPSLDLSLAKRPELTFWHAQDEWGPTNYDRLRVYYKKSSGGSWVLLEEYLELTPDWEQRSIFIPEEALSGTFYLAFEGESNWGFGAVLDDIELIERGIIPMNIDSLSITHPSLTTIPSSEKNAPVLLIYKHVYGNAGKVYLDSLTINALNDDNNDVSSPGVKLFVTSSPKYVPENQIGTSQTIVDGKAKFTNINHQLNYGDNYIWVTYDVDASAEGRNTLDMEIEAGEIYASFDQSSTTYDSNLYIDGDSVIYIIDGDTNSVPLYYHLPETAASPPGEFTISHSIFYDDFETDKGWTLEGDFERDAPEGRGGSEGGYADPASPYSPVNILGNDLTGLGSKSGDYEDGIVTPYYATSPIFDAYYYNGLKLQYKEWMNIETTDDASIEVSADSGANWTTVWNSIGDLSNDRWVNKIVNLSQWGFDRCTGLQVRYSINYTDLSGSRSGWNIDNFAITSNYIDDDVGISQVIAPANGCGHTSNDSVTVIVKNYGATPAEAPIPVAYSFNGGAAFVYDTIKQNIPYGDSIQFTFTQRTDLSAPAVYQAVYKTILGDDQDSLNNEMTNVLYVQPTLTPSLLEEFETDDGLWMPGGKFSSWEWGEPAGYIYESGVHESVWATTLNGTYNPQEYSYIESPCYNFANTDRQMLQFDYWLETEVNTDGFNVYYSIDGGENWELLDTNNYGWDWEWYDDTLYTGERGWTGEGSDWNTAKQLIPDDLAQSSIGKVRFVFYSDSTLFGLKGLAVDNFELFELQDDIGVSSFDILKDTCQNTVSDIPEVYIKNYGITQLETNDTVIVGFDFESDPPVIDTFLLSGDLAPGDSVKHIFTQGIDITTPGNYSIYSYTLIEDDPWYYFDNNDTTWLDFTIWQNPITLLQDTIQSKEPDTVVLKPYYDANYDYYWWHDGSTNPTFPVPADGVYKLTVTENTHGCETLDSVYVEFLFNDVGIDSILWPVSSCELGSAEYVQVQVHNFGTDSIIAGDKIRVLFEFEGGPAVLDTITLGSSFHSGDDLWYTFNKGPVDVSSIGAYDIKAYSDYGGDTVAYNDTIERSITVFGYPTVDIGPDTTVKALSYSMDAGSGFVSYDWSDGDSVQVKEITQSGEYSIHVFDVNGCDARDTADIHFKIRDVYARSMLSPINKCARQGLDQVQMRILNNGTDTIRTTDNINVKYNINGGGFVSAIVPLTSDLLPGDSIDYTFSTQEDLTGIGAYDFIVIGTSPGDLRTWNDTVLQTVVNNAVPDIDFDIEEPVIRALEYTLDAGAGADWSYNWQDNSTEQTYVATNTGQYSVVVTDTLSGCVGGDTIFLLFVITDITINSIDYNLPVCVGSNEGVSVELVNNGNQPLGGAEFELSYKIDDGTLITENVVNSQQWAVDASWWYTLSNSLNFTSEGESNVLMYISKEDDLRKDNDTVNTLLDIGETPSVNLGDPSIFVPLPHTLDAGAGYASYLWNDNTTNQTLVVNENGTYSVTVTSANGCEASDQIIVRNDNVANPYTRSNLHVDIYPNPTDAIIHVSFKLQNPEDLIIEIMSVNNQLVYYDEIPSALKYENSIDLSEVPEGLYFIRIRGENIYQLSKIIKQ